MSYYQSAGNLHGPHPDGYFDPYQVFKVTHRPCFKLYIKVIRGINITKGKYADLVDTPDPYITLFIDMAPNSNRKTTAKDNDVNPSWDETFEFFIDAEKDTVLELSLYDANYLYDELLCTRTLKIVPLPVKVHHKKLVQFNETSQVEIEMWAEQVLERAELRFSLTLCDEEKDFVEERREKVLDAMKKKYGTDAPKKISEIPIVGVLGSGGGFRAMTGLSGAMTGLVDSGVLDMTTYVAGLSGSAWYLSTLYSHPDWPKKSPEKIRQELKKSVENSPFRLLGPQSLYSYVARIVDKRRHGQPVSFTDFFGHLVGDTLLGDRLTSKLSDQKKKVAGGKIPMPLYTCLHVKKHVSAKVFHEWMEFSPFEIGLPKYGTFMRPELFGSKFFLGYLVKKFPEPPLHYLQGVWGSAFCIQFKMLLQSKNRRMDPVAMMRDQADERAELEKELEKELDMQVDEESDVSEDDQPKQSETLKLKRNKFGNESIRRLTVKSNEPKKKGSYSRRSCDKSFWTTTLESMLDSSNLLRTIEGRAAIIHNFMRELSVTREYAISPFETQRKRSTDSCRDTFDGIFEEYPTHYKKLYVVDGGLTFNSPFPLLLRPQRMVDIILSFDFSARPSDTTPPFKELKLAEKWARLNHVPFPEIDETVVDREGLKECYIFEDEKDHSCPIVMHFPLVNIHFREEKAPGVPRETEEEKRFADFDIFDDMTNPYSTFNFTYTNEAFDRLSQLTEYNMLLHKEVIFEKIKQRICVRKRHISRCRRPVKSREIRRLGLGNRAEKKLLHFIASFDEDESS